MFFAMFTVRNWETIHCVKAVQTIGGCINARTFVSTQGFWAPWFALRVADMKRTQHASQLTKRQKQCFSLVTYAAINLDCGGLVMQALYQTLLKRAVHFQQLLKETLGPRGYQVECDVWRRSGNLCRATWFIRSKLKQFRADLDFTDCDLYIRVNGKAMRLSFYPPWTVWFVSYCTPKYSLPSVSPESVANWLIE
jgi:hypothetical protein